MALRGPTIEQRPVGDVHRAPADFRVAVEDANCPCGEQRLPWRELASGATCDAEIVRIKAVDLRSAARATAEARQSATSQGLRIVVMLDVEVLIDDNAALARRQLSNLEQSSGSPHLPASLLYVGTARGLISLLTDIQTLDIADGVTLLALPAPNVERRISSEVMPMLEQKGLVASFRS